MFESKSTFENVFWLSAQLRSGNFWKQINFAHHLQKKKLFKLIFLLLFWFDASFNT